MESHLNTSQQGNLRILVVEDHAAVRQGLSALLTLFGHQAAFATNLQSALRLADANRYDLLLCDIGLPDGDGWELLRRLKRTDRCPTHAVAMSCLTSPADLDRSEAAGFAVHLGKPFTADQLEAVLKVDLLPVSH